MAGGALAGGEPGGARAEPVAGSSVAVVVLGGQWGLAAGEGEEPFMRSGSLLLLLVVVVGGACGTMGAGSWDRSVCVAAGPGQLAPGCRGGSEWPMGPWHLPVWQGTGSMAPTRARHPCTQVFSFLFSFLLSPLTLTLEPPLSPLPPASPLPAPPSPPADAVPMCLVTTPLLLKSNTYECNPLPACLPSPCRRWTWCIYTTRRRCSCRRWARRDSGARWCRWGRWRRGRGLHS